jgi:hypothetical protein
MESDHLVVPLSDELSVDDMSLAQRFALLYQDILNWTIT